MNVAAHPVAVYSVFHSTLAAETAQDFSDGQQMAVTDNPFPCADFVLHHDLGDFIFLAVDHSVAEDFRQKFLGFTSIFLQGADVGREAWRAVIIVAGF